MSDSYSEITTGSGLKYRTDLKTVGANAVHDQYVIGSDPGIASYILPTGACTIGASGQCLAQLMAGASLNVYVRRIQLVQSVLAGALTTFVGQVQRLTTAGTAGTSETANIVAFDTTDAAVGATAIRNPTPGTLGAFFHPITFELATAAPIRGHDGGQNQWMWEARRDRGIKPIRIPAGTANGIAIRSFGAIATATIQVVFEFTEQNF